MQKRKLYPIIKFLGAYFSFDRVMTLMKKLYLYFTILDTYFAGEMNNVIVSIYLFLFLSTAHEQYHSSTHSGEHHYRFAYAPVSHHCVNGVGAWLTHSQMITI